jgi:hypothetical protein
MHKEAQALLNIVQAELSHDVPSGPQWIVAEGERVLENVKAFYRAVQEDKELALLGGIPLMDFVGSSWLEVCEPAYNQCKNLQLLLEAKQNAI